ncbi:hypothetical protein CTA1_1357 [Colletotrichum tanaceti]|uniref:Uncharacterized protein n=1 Tax=Colletotrichum tanaceti TaxID=1306861 RepID=A0A4V6DFJ6_9PEZI|nr:hypothetical protein CTA1_1357 [Colletotrichum tanaceti]
MSGKVGTISDQVSREKLEELAPNGEGKYILERIDGMSEEEALEIVEASVEFFKDDWNFPLRHEGAHEEAPRRGQAQGLRRQLRPGPEDGPLHKDRAPGRLPLPGRHHRRHLLRRRRHPKLHPGKRGGLVYPDPDEPLHVRQRRRAALCQLLEYVYKLLSAALTAGVAVSALVMFFAVGYNPIALKWWGNTVSGAGVDGRQIGILPIPERGYLGPERGTFPT